MSSLSLLQFFTTDTPAPAERPRLTNSVAGWRRQVRAIDAEVQQAAADDNVGALEAQRDGAEAALRQAESLALAQAVTQAPALTLRFAPGAAVTASPAVLAAQDRLRGLRQRTDDAVDLAAQTKALVDQARADLGLDSDAPYLR